VHIKRYIKRSVGVPLTGVDGVVARLPALHLGGHAQGLSGAAGGR
jgi:hypothetical protein